jgi:hypothetical protein
MPPIEIPGLKAEIEKGEFRSWTDDELIQFMYQPGGPLLPNLQNPTAHDLRWFAAIHQFKWRHVW